MRFAMNSTAARSLYFAKNTSDWPLSFRLALYIIPMGIAVALFAVWTGYWVSSATLVRALENHTLLQAQLQASRMTETLRQLRHNLLRIVQESSPNAQTLREKSALFFQDNDALVHEISFKDSKGNGFLLLRDQDDYRLLDFAEASSGPYSPFQQVNTLTLLPGEVALFPVVYFDDPSITPSSHERSRHIPIMRMALMLPDEPGGILILGINVAQWRDRLATLMRPDPSLRPSIQDDALQLAFFFDMRGWILFEMEGSGGKSYLPDRARLGYTGDLGRTGFDAAFRPWSAHENYWRMIKEVEASRSGSVPAPVDKYALAQAGATGLLCFAPVRFSSSDTAEPVAVGGIAFFETSTLPLAAFMRLANFSLLLLAGVFIIFALLAYRVNRKLAVPLAEMANNLSKAAESNERIFLHSEPACKEHQKLQAAVNSIISNAMATQNDLVRMQHVRAVQPADLRLPLATPLPEAEFGLVGSSPLIRSVREQVRKAARAGIDVMIWGETGTGKELVAAAIHKNGKHCKGPYLSINCGALDENLLLDTLFGHVKGAFTEARSDRRGAFIAANNGTLHLDEIGNASPKVQQALLRALSARRIRPLGSDKELPFSTRVVAATNVNLRDCVRAGTFREDLYYRLAVISIEMPPLRHRKEDIPELAAFCIHEAAASLKRPETPLSRGALDIIVAHDWPGNVREFKNCITRTMAFVEGDIILPQHIVLEQETSCASALSGETDLTDGSHAAYSSFSRALEDDAGSGWFPATAGIRPDKAETPLTPPPREIGYASEQLWPAPPREFFTPAREEKKKNAGSEPETPLPPNLSIGESADVASGKEFDLNERQKKALEILNRAGGFTRAQYERVSGQEVSLRTAQNDLREMVELGILERVGAGPSTRYILRTRKS